MLLNLQKVAFGLYLLLSLPDILADVESRPLLQREYWRLENPDSWEWREVGASTCLVLKKLSHNKPKVVRPRNIAWFAGAEWESFTLTCEARLDAINDGNNDLCIAFGCQSDTEFYYAHLGEVADDVHLHLHIVNNSDRKPITMTRARILPWQPDRWHQVKLERDVSNGSMKVFFDQQLVLEANDKTFSKGRIGLGSFDDLGAFRNVTVIPGATSALISDL